MAAFLSRALRFIFPSRYEPLHHLLIAASIAAAILLLEVTPRFRNIMPALTISCSRKPDS
jgi:hypothetical protein